MAVITLCHLLGRSAADQELELDLLVNQQLAHALIERDAIVGQASLHDHHAP
jgi:hypothetical protein